MPSLRKIPIDEAKKMQNRQGRAVDLSEYITHIIALDYGEMGEAKLESDEKKPTIKRRLTTAARRAGKALRYHRTSEDRIIYQVVQRND